MWSPALMHVVNNALVMLVVVDGPLQQTAQVGYMLVSISVSVTMLIVAATWSRAPSQPSA